MLRSLSLFIPLIWFTVSSASTSRAADLGKLFPKETDIVVTLNVRQVLDSPAVKNNALDLIKTSLSSSKEAQQAIKALGLDPLHDFNRVSIGIGLENLAQPKAVVILEGKFDVKKITETLDSLVKGEPAQYGVEKVSGKSIWKLTTPNQPYPMFAAPIDGNLVVVATNKENVVAAFDSVNETAKPRISKELAVLLSKRTDQSSLFMAAHTKGKLNSIPLADNDMKKIIDQVHSITADLKVATDLNLELTIGTGDLDEAKKMKDLVEGGIDLAKIQAKVALAAQPELQPLLDFFNSMSAARTDKMVVVSGKLRGDAIEKLFKK